MEDLLLWIAGANALEVEGPLTRFYKYPLMHYLRYVVAIICASRKMCNRAQSDKRMDEVLGKGAKRLSGKLCTNCRNRID